MNASFDRVWISNVTIDPATIWQCSISNTGIINEMYVIVQNII